MKLAEQEESFSRVKYRTEGYTAPRPGYKCKKLDRYIENGVCHLGTNMDNLKDLQNRLRYGETRGEEE